jgi:tRNA-specific 2-thiouridylase
LILPIGQYSKAQVRDIARQAGLGISEKPDSVEICFVPDGDHGQLIRSRRPELATTGHFVDTAGRVLAEHPGIENYTIGQRKGLGYAAGARRYVLRIIPETNDVVLGDRDELLSSGLLASEVNWLIDVRPSSLSCSVKIRYRHNAAAATVTPMEDGEAKVEFAEPQTAVTPGQAVVFYDGARVLGGGWIEEPISLR